MKTFGTKLTAGCSTVALVLSALTCTALAQPAAQVDPNVPKLPPSLLVDVQIGTGVKVPMGMGAKRPQVTELSANSNEDMRTLSIALTNVSNKQQDAIQVNWALYKLDRSGVVKEMAKKSDRVSMAPMEKKLVVGQGKFAVGGRSVGEQSEEFYGWYVKVTVAGDTIYEKSNPLTLKTSEHVKKSFQGRR